MEMVPNGLCRFLQIADIQRLLLQQLLLLSPPHLFIPSEPDIVALTFKVIAAVGYIFSGVVSSK